ncbi:MAG: dephospho-CoA kinase [Limnochordaceae bacterium]|nr:dephospho-CoA kinase [Limnochordaceae bacterium]
MALVVGLTGGIASGKSTVLRMLRELGVVTLDADQVVRELEQPGTEEWTRIVNLFGRDVVRTDGQLDRARLARKVFADPVARRQLEEIVHPAVYARLRQQLDDVFRQLNGGATAEAGTARAGAADKGEAERDAGAKTGAEAPAIAKEELEGSEDELVIVVDIPLLFESEAAKWLPLNRVAVVSVTPEVQRQRLMRRDGLTAEQAEQRLRAQWPLAEKVQRADDVVDNSGGIENTRSQVQRLVARWRQLAREGERP